MHSRVLCTWSAQSRREEELEAPTFRDGACHSGFRGLEVLAVGGASFNAVLLLALLPGEGFGLARVRGVLGGFAAGGFDSGLYGFVGKRACGEGCLVGHWWFYMGDSWVLVYGREGEWLVGRHGRGRGKNGEKGRVSWPLTYSATTTRHKLSSTLG